MKSGLETINFVLCFMKLWTDENHESSSMFSCIFIFHISHSFNFSISKHSAIPRRFLWFFLPRSLTFSIYFVQVRWDDENVVDSNRHNRVSAWEIEPNRSSSPKSHLISGSKRSRVITPSINADYPHTSNLVTNQILLF